MTTPCIEWPYRKNHNGYGVILINGKQFFAHRLAVALSGRNIPKSKVCDHLCRNHACINPDHLELVSPKENWKRGESHTKHLSLRDKCANGHAFTKTNTRLFTDKNGRTSRHCRRCYADREDARRRRLGVPMFRRTKYAKTK